MRISTVFAITIVLLAVTAKSIGQTVEVLQQSGYRHATVSREFAFIEPTTDTGSLKYIATIRATGDGNNTDIDLIYFDIREKALNLGGNCFKLNSYKELESMHTAALTLDIYYGTDAALYVNFLNHEKNVVYILGSPYSFSKTYSFKADSSRKEIKGGTYYKHVNQVGQEVQFSKGLINGVDVTVKWGFNKPAKFFAITGFVPMVIPMIMPAGLYLSSKAGKFHDVNGNLGHLLISIMKKSE